MQESAKLVAAPRHYSVSALAPFVLLGLSRAVQNERLLDAVHGCSSPAIGERRGNKGIKMMELRALCQRFNHGWEAKCTGLPCLLRACFTASVFMARASISAVLFSLQRQGCRKTWHDEMCAAPGGEAQGVGTMGSTRRAPGCAVLGTGGAVCQHSRSKGAPAVPCCYWRWGSRRNFSVELLA